MFKFYPRPNISNQILKETKVPEKCSSNTKLHNPDSYIRHYQKGFRIVGRGNASMYETATLIFGGII